MTVSVTPRIKRFIAVSLALFIIVVAVLTGWKYRRHLQANPLSEDAVLQAYVVHISAAVPGKLTDLVIKENDHVTKGQLLFRVEPEIYELRLQQAEAELALAKASFTSKERQIRAETANSAIANEQIARAKSNLELAEKTLQRLRPLASKGYVTKQQLDAAKTAQRDAEISLNQAKAQSDAAFELVGETEAAQATVDMAQAAVAVARKALSDTIVRAPHDGLAVGLNVSDGEHLAPGESLFTLINTEQWYATALFRETDLSLIKIGTCATVYALADPERAIQGRVASIGWGVSTEDMISLPRSLPYIQKSLNWVRVAQRYPVRISLESPPVNLMRVGASASVIIRSDSQC